MYSHTVNIEKISICLNSRLRVVPHFSSGIVERAKRERAWKSSHARKDDTRRVAFSRVGDFHERPRFARSTIPEEKWGLLVVYLNRGREESVGNDDVSIVCARKYEMV